MVIKYEYGYRRHQKLRAGEKGKSKEQRSEGARERDVQFNYSNEVYREQQGELYIYLYDIVYPM